jgi:hypothetical protein
MSGMLKLDSAMFSGHENCRSAPPDAHSVCALVGWIALDDCDIRRRRETLDEVGDRRPDDDAADDRDVAPSRAGARVTPPS